MENPQLIKYFSLTLFFKYGEEAVEFFRSDSPEIVLVIFVISRELLKIKIFPHKELKCSVYIALTVFQYFCTMIGMKPIPVLIETDIVIVRPRI